MPSEMARTVCWATFVSDNARARATRVYVKNDHSSSSGVPVDVAPARARDARVRESPVNDRIHRRA